MAVEIKNNPLLSKYSEKAAPRQSVDQLRRKDPEAAIKELEKSKKFAIQMVLLNAQNQGLEDDNNSQSTEIMQTANLIAQLDSVGAQIAEMQKMTEAVQNPGYNALELPDKEVFFDDSKRSFYGDPVSFSYNINHGEEELSSVVSAVINIKDSNGKIVYTHNESNLKKGEHSFVWGGVDNRVDNNRRNKMDSGSYNIEVQAYGKKNENGKQTSFKVDSQSVLSGIVQAVDIEGGIATKLILENGKSINKDQVISVNNVKETKSDIELSHDLIYKNAELDLSKAQVSSSGKLNVYYNNHVANPGKMEIKVYDKKNNLVKTLEHRGDIVKGGGKISFDKTGLKSGNYTVEINVEDKDIDNSKITLSSEARASIVGINYENKTFISMDEREYSTHNIRAIIVNYETPLQQRGNEYMQLPSVTYKNDKFKYQNTAPFAPEMSVKKNFDGNAFSYSIMNIYDENNELVKTIKATDDLYNKLNHLSKRSADNHIALNGLPPYNQMTSEQQIEINDHIRNQIHANVWSLEQPFQAEFDQDVAIVKWPSWDGSYTPGIVGQAQDNSIYRTEFTPVYLTNDGSIVAGPTTINTSTSKVDSFEIEKEELILHLADGKQIFEDIVI